MREGSNDLPGIGEVARLVGLDADTLRFYERRGILPSPSRDAGGRRRYSPSDVEAIRRLVALKSTGMSLADIAHFARLQNGDLDSIQVEILRRQEAELRARRRSLDASLEFLDHKLENTGSVARRVRHLTSAGTDIAYSVTGSGPWLFLVGAPAGRSGFAALATALSQVFTVVTHDPRGTGDSAPPTATVPTPEVLADDLLALVDALAAEPVHLFGTSGGAVTVLEVLTKESQLVASAMVHEPPLALLLDDPEFQRRVTQIFELADRDPQRAFEEWLDATGAGQSTGPGESPTRAGALPALSPEELERNRYFLGRMAGPTVFHQPDIDALVEHPPTVAAGRLSHGQFARRASEALASRLDLPLQEMPGNHLAASTHADEVAQVIVAHTLA